MAASKTIDFLVYGFEFLGITIIAADSEEVKEAIVSKLGLGVTVYLGSRGYTNKGQEILFCVCSRLEAPKVKALVRELDESAFITIQKISDSYGGTLKRAKHLH